MRDSIKLNDSLNFFEVNTEEMDKEFIEKMFELREMRDKYREEGLFKGFIKRGGTCEE